MNPVSPHEIAHALIRWIHIAAGVIWIGHLYFFNFVNAGLMAALDAETKKKVVPELMPRALFWFRWGAAWTWLTGLLLLALVYWAQPNFGNSGVNEMGKALVALGIIVVAFLVYDQIAKAFLKKPMVGLAIWYALALGFGFYLYHVPGYFESSQRAAFIHVGALFGTAMAANVWMRIWPAQRRNIEAIKAGRPPDPADVATAGQRSRHNTFMSFPVLFLMLAGHTDQIGITFGRPWAWMIGVFVVGWLVTLWMYSVAGKLRGA